jgi:hypothetical protein
MADIEFPISFDPMGMGRNSVASLYGVSAIPVKFVIDADGKIVGSTVGAGAAATARPEPAAVPLNAKEPIDKILEKIGISY